MEIILDKTFIHELSIKHSKSSISLDRILNNSNNYFVVNQKLFAYIEAYLSPELLVKWQNTFTYLSDNAQLISSNEDTLDSSKLFNESYKKSDFKIILSNNSFNNSCSLNIQTKKDELFLSIMENSIIVFRSTDFLNQNEIIDFFNQVFEYSKFNGRIILISRYNNFNCQLINSLKLKFIEKDFWTTKKTTSCDTNSLQKMQLILGNKLRIFTTENEYLHERKILIGNCVLEFDDAFDKINHSYKTWNCTFSISQNLSKKIISSKTPHLTRLK